jgi:intracellular septation protein A
MIAVFDIGAPLAAYNLLRSAGLSAVAALVLSGVFPAVGLAARAITRRRIDAVGAVVLAGILVGAVVGLITHSARLVLLEGSVPTAVFGLACLGSLRTRRPLMFSIALEFNGPDTAQGQEFTSLWRHEEFRRLFRVITAVWGVAFLVEAALRVVIVYSTSTSTALALSKVTPFIWAGILMVWTFAYGAYHKKKGEQQMAAAGGDGDQHEAEQTAAPAVLEPPNPQP